MDSLLDRSPANGSRRTELHAGATKDGHGQVGPRTTVDRFSRPLTREGIREAAGIGALLWLGGLTFLVAALLIDDLQSERAVLLGSAAIGAFACLGLTSFRLMTDDVQFRWAGAVLGVSGVLAVGVVTGLVLRVGQVLPEVVVF